MQLTKPPHACRELLLAAKLTHLADLDLGLAARPVEAEAAAAGLDEDDSDDAAYEVGTGVPPVAISSRGLAALAGLRGLRRLGLRRWEGYGRMHVLYALLRQLQQCGLFAPSAVCSLCQWACKRRLAT